MDVNPGGTEGNGRGRQALWACLAASRNREEYFTVWLELQSSFLPNAVQSVLIIGDPETAKYTPVAKWPVGETYAERLADISERVLGERCGLLTELEKPADLPPGSPSRYGIGYPVAIDGKLYGTVTVEVAARSEGDLRSVMEQLQWGVLALELIFQRERAVENEAILGSLRSSVDLLAGVLAEENFEHACMTFVTGISVRLKCDRVSLGFLKNNSISVQAISHSSQFDKRMNLIEAIGLAMDEAIFQRHEVIYPLSPGDAPIVSRNHEEMAGKFGVESIMTIPLYGNEKYYGALTLERRSEKSFGKDEANLCRSMFALAAPALEGKRIQSRLLIFHAWESLKQQTGRLIGPGHSGRKLAAAVIAALIVFFSFANGDYRVTGDASLEGAIRRSIAAPFKGFIKEARVRAGDKVRESDLLCTMDDRDLRLEKINLGGQQNQLLREHLEAFSQHDWAKLNVIDAQLDQVIAQMNLTDLKLKRVDVSAPFDAIIVSGDLSQKLGAAVDQGEVLFELAPLTAYRVILQVNENSIADVKKGQRGVLLLSSLRDRFTFEIEKITPVSTAAEGKNTFRVEARLLTVSEKLRPGMEGVGKIFIEHRKLISIWTKDLTDWLRIWMWSRWP